MKKLIIASVVVLLANTVNAQQASVPAGKKFQVLTNLQSTTTVSQMGQEMQIPSVADITTDFEIKSASANSVALGAITKKMKIKVSLMGQEQTIDSDDPNAASNPMMAEAFKDINKAKDITVNLGKLDLTTDVTGAQATEDIAHVLFIPIDAKTKEGASIKDSTSNADGSKQVNVYTVTKSTPQEITLTITINAKMGGTKQQMGTEVKVNMQTSATATRVYDAATGLLKSETKTFSSSGTNEMMGQSIPISMKGTSTLTVK